jgi:hypothetical protein
MADILGDWSRLEPIDADRFRADVETLFDTGMYFDRTEFRVACSTRR